MKKYVVCGIALCWLSGSFVCSDVFAESYSLTDFLFGRPSASERGHREFRSKVNQKWDQRRQAQDVEETEDDQEENLVEHRAERHPRNKIDTALPEVKLENIPEISQPVPELKDIPEIPQNASTNEEIEINEKEIYVSPSLTVNSADELMSNVTKNIKCIEKGKMSESDRNNLQKEKELIAKNIEQFKNLQSVYDKVHLFAIILKSYNIVNEIPVRFLPNINKDDISKVQVTLLADSLKANQENLAKDFKAALSEQDNSKISELTKIDVSQNLNGFASSLLEKVKSIPTELLDNNAGKRVEEATKIFNTQINGNFAEKQSVMLNMFNAYNSLKEISFRLCKIDNEVIKNLAIKITEDLFAKIKNDLKIMKKSNYSINADEDEIALAARNIQKLETMLFGGQMASGTSVDSRVERFKKTDLTNGKKKVLKEVISQFNKTAKYCNEALALLREKGKNGESIALISEDIDKIFAKISEYDKPNPTSLSNPEFQEDSNKAPVEQIQKEKVNEETSEAPQPKKVAEEPKEAESKKVSESSEIKSDSINIEDLEEIEDEEVENAEDEEVKNTEKELAEIAESSRTKK